MYFLRLFFEDVNAMARKNHWVLWKARRQPLPEEVYISIYIYIYIYIYLYIYLYICIICRIFFAVTVYSWPDVWHVRISKFYCVLLKILTNLWFGVKCLLINLMNILTILVLNLLYGGLNQIMLRFFLVWHSLFFRHFS